DYKIQVAYFPTLISNYYPAIISFMEKRINSAKVIQDALYRYELWIQIAIKKAERVREIGKKIT
ncbi:21096_t:CDS:1, partial [Gigaspora margarita]